jgi:hypothetical protein
MRTVTTKHQSKYFEVWDSDCGETPMSFIKDRGGGEGKDGDRELMVGSDMAGAPPGS